MSGTAGGTIALHISPEASDPSSVLGIVRTGDAITCDVSQRLLRIDISPEEVTKRVEERAAAMSEKSYVWNARKTARGYRGLYMRSVNQAHRGADFDFLRAEGPDEEG